MMSRRSLLSKPEIAIYQTDGSGQILFSLMVKDIAQNPALRPFDVSLVSAAQIRQGYLHKPNVVGFIGPGCNSAEETYRRKLTHQGLHQVATATQAGLHVSATCGAAYAFTGTTLYHNKYQPQDYKVVKSRTPLLNGVSQGIITELCDARHLPRLKARHIANPHSDERIPANIITITLRRPQPGQLATIAATYNGGGRFYPDASEDVDIIAHHEQTADKTPAGIRFARGHGLVEFWNIHQEVTARHFKNVFNKAEKAVKTPAAFHAHLTALQNSEAALTGLMTDFIANALENGKLARPKPLLTVPFHGLPTTR